MKKFTLFCFLLLLSTLLWSQSRLITGKVTAADDASELIGVSIQVEGTDRGTVTDFDGTYSLEIEPGDQVLIFSYIGYETYRVELSGQSVVDVSMETESQMLADVVVIGYGTIRKSDLTGSVYSVKSEELKKIPNANPVNALQGKVPGLQVSNYSGNPGEAPVVRIRGVGTLLSNASPIYVVDGIILDDISFLNNDDIESMEVLKDASATAIYGSRGANGVIIVTTKKGEVGNVVFNASASLGIENIARKIELLDRNQFAELRNELNPGTYNNIDALPNTDWQDLIFQKNTPIQKYSLSAAGAGEKISYYLGGTFFDQEGIIEKSDFQRISLKANSTIKATDFLTIGSLFSFSRIDKTNPPGIVATAYRGWPTEKPLNEAGEFIEVQKTGNPLASLEYSNNFTDKSRGTGNIYGEIKFLEDFTFKSSYQIDLEYTDGLNFTPEFYVSPLQQVDENELTKRVSKNTFWLFENTLNYFKDLNRHRIYALAGYTSQLRTNEYLESKIRNLLREGEDFWYIDAGADSTLVSSNRRSEEAILSSLFRINYVFDEKYLMTATFRRDGSSKFAEKNRYGNFPSFALGWRVSEEPFYNSEFIPRLKFRASWGIIGNEKISYDARFKRIEGGNDYAAVFNENLTNGASIRSLGNPDLKWEQTMTFDLGLEFGLFKDRLSGELEYFRKQTGDALVGLEVPGHIGEGTFSEIVYNTADILNSGIELNLTYNTRLFSGVKSRFTFVASKLHNEVTELSETRTSLISGSLGNSQRVTRSEPGYAVGSFYGYNVIGVLQNDNDVANSATLSGQEPGDLKYEDLNADGVITTDDRKFIGSYIPDYLMGLNMNFNYRSFNLSIDLQSQLGNEIYNGKKAVRPEIYNYETDVIDRWRPEDPSSTEPRVNNKNNLNYSISSYFVEDASFLRLRNITLGYDLPKSIISKLHITKGSIFVSGTNLYTLTKFSGYSPELSTQNVLTSGIDLGVYPITRITTVGLNITF